MACGQKAHSGDTINFIGAFSLVLIVNEHSRFYSHWLFAEILIIIFYFRTNFCMPKNGEEPNIKIRISQRGSGRGGDDEDNNNKKRMIMN